MSPEHVDPPVAGLTVPAQVLVTGASSGIGLAMVRQLLDAATGRVFAVSRNASNNAELAALATAAGGRLHLHDADLCSDDDLERLARSVAQHTGVLHLVVHAAGLLHAAGIEPEKSLQQVDRASLERVFAINAYAPVLLAKVLQPLLCHREPVVFATLSARVGSIGDNRAGGWYAYRASKAAQNQLVKTLSIELARRNPRSCCLMLHPGTVDTPLSAPFQARVPDGKLFAPERAARQLLQIVARSTAADNGRFIAWDASGIPW